MLDLLEELDAIIAITNKINRRLQDNDKERADASSTLALPPRSPVSPNCLLSPTNSTSNTARPEVSRSEPMQLGLNHLFTGERAAPLRGVVFLLWTA